MQGKSVSGQKFRLKLSLNSPIPSRDKIVLMEKERTGSFKKYLVGLAGLLIILLILLFTRESFNQPPLLTPVVTLQKSPTILSGELEATQIAIHATPSPQPSATPWEIATATPLYSQKPTTSYFLNPFTGISRTRLETDGTDPGEDIFYRKPLLVKLLNWPRDQRPLSKINQADVVFEYYSGHQTNQLLALYYGNEAERVGPLGPGALIDARLARHYQSNLVVSTVDTVVKGVFDNTLPDQVFYQGYTSCPGICTEPLAVGGQTFVNIPAIQAIVRDQRFKADLFRLSLSPFSTILTDWDEEATRFSYLYADFSVMDWRYNPISKKYELWQEVVDENNKLVLAPSSDSSGKVIEFDNLLFLSSDYIEYNATTYDINMREGDTSQRAILLREGKLTFGTWGSDSATEPFKFYAYGKEYGLKPGKSWITFVSRISRPEKVADGEWDLEFRLD